LILYIGDFDPSGMYMSQVDLPKRLVRYSSDDPAEKNIDLEWANQALDEIGLEIRRIALVEDDTIALGEETCFAASDKADTVNPETGEKKKGDSRYHWFVQNYGPWCWELDALSPNILRDRLERAIVAELDQDVWDRYVRIEAAEREIIKETCRPWGAIPVPDQE
jgi:hypothetical protein